MKDLAPPDSFHLQAARSCLESRNLRGAQLELDKVAPELRNHPDVLEVRWALEAHAKNWRICLDIAQAILACAPGRPSGWIKHSFALHRLQRTQEALNSLFPAAENFSRIAVIPYNLACYSAELKCLWEAERWLKRAFEVGGGEIRKMALRDKDLAPLWNKIGQW
jgi:hypothetical protein